MVNSIATWGKMNKVFSTAAVVLAGFSLQVSMPAQSNPASSQTHSTPAWVKRSDQNAQVLLKVIADLSPEGAGQLGVEGVDEKISDFGPGANERARKALTPAVAELQSRLATEKDPLVVQDLHILIKAGKDPIRETELDDKYDIPYSNLSRHALFWNSSHPRRASLPQPLSRSRRSLKEVRGNGTGL